MHVKKASASFCFERDNGKANSRPLQTATQCVHAFVSEKTAAPLMTRLCAGACRPALHPSL
jgi:hypothetical protein